MLGDDSQDKELKDIFYQEFLIWFHNSSVDFWSESNAPDELALIAAKIVREITTR